MKLSEDTIEPLDTRLKALEGAMIIKTTQELPRVMGASAMVAKASLPSEASLQPKRLEIFDQFGTRAAYIGEPTPGTYEFHTISLSAIPDLEPHLLGTVATKAALPVNVSTFTTPAARLYDYIHVQADESMGGQTVRYYVNAVSPTGVITWGSPLVVNMGSYQTKTTTAMGGKLLVGGAQAGAFGDGLTVANTVPDTPNDTQVMTAGAVMDAISSATPEIDTATNDRLGLVKGYNGTTAGHVQVLGGATATAGTMQVIGWDKVDELDTLLTPDIRDGLEAASTPSASNPFLTNTSQAMSSLASRVTTLELEGGGGSGGGGEVVPLVSRRGVLVSSGTGVPITPDVALTAPANAYYARVDTSSVPAGVRVLIRVGVNVVKDFFTETVNRSMEFEVYPGASIVITCTPAVTTGTFRVFFWDATFLTPEGQTVRSEPTISRMGTHLGTVSEAKSIVAPPDAYYAVVGINRSTNPDDVQVAYYVDDALMDTRLALQTTTYAVMEVKPGSVLVCGGSATTKGNAPFFANFFGATIAGVAATDSIMARLAALEAKRPSAPDLTTPVTVSVGESYIVPPEEDGYWYRAMINGTVTADQQFLIAVDGVNLVNRFAQTTMVFNLVYLIPFPLRAGQKISSVATGGTANQRTLIKFRPKV
jgi:hypothetical protein